MRMVVRVMVRIVVRENEGENYGEDDIEGGDKEGGQDQMVVEMWKGCGDGIFA